MKRPLLATLAVLTGCTVQPKSVSPNETPAPLFSGPWHAPERHLALLLTENGGEVRGVAFTLDAPATAAKPAVAFVQGTTDGDRISLSLKSVHVVAHEPDGQGGRPFLMTGCTEDGAICNLVCPRDLCSCAEEVDDVAADACQAKSITGDIDGVFQLDPGGGEQGIWIRSGTLNLESGEFFFRRPPAYFDDEDQLDEGDGDCAKDGDGANDADGDGIPDGCLAWAPSGIPDYPKCGEEDCGYEQFFAKQRCGNGQVDSPKTPEEFPAEECERVGDASCTYTCRTDSCGDALFEQARGEQCDDGPDNDAEEPNACRTDCKNPWCGDGVHDNAWQEECDCGVTEAAVAGAQPLCDEFPANADEPDHCKPDTCKLPTCSDGHRDGRSLEILGAAAEECDCGEDGPAQPGVQPLCDEFPGNANEPDHCKPDTCTLPACGDGYWDRDASDVSGSGVDEEQCDCGKRGHTPQGGPVGLCDIGLNNCDEGIAPAQCPADTCRNDCTTPFCGDGILDRRYSSDGVEECDDGDNGVLTDDCTVGCDAAFCGDGFTWEGHEACDDGNLDNTDTCLDTCISASCGDGFLWAGEEDCDDGNADSSDYCKSDCYLNVCGDGVVRVGVEQCDDDNAISSDSCRSDIGGCVWNRCGDGVRQLTETDSEDPDPRETCDDGNTSNNDACKNDCTPNVCLDGYVRPGEECDDGDDDDNDYCRNSCVLNVCGDGSRRDGVEHCDDGGDDEDVDGCTASCRRGIGEPCVRDADCALGDVCLGSAPGVTGACSRECSSDTDCGANGACEFVAPGTSTQCGYATCGGGDPCETDDFNQRNALVYAPGGVAGCGAFCFRTCDPDRSSPCGCQGDAVCLGALTCAMRGIRFDIDDGEDLGVCVAAACTNDSQCDSTLSGVCLQECANICSTNTLGPKCLVSPRCTDGTPCQAGSGTGLCAVGCRSCGSGASCGGS